MRSFVGVSGQAVWGRSGENPVRPLCAALPQLCLAPLVVAVGLGASIRWPWVVAVASALLLVAFWRALKAAVELERRRRIADQWLLWGAAARPSSGLLDWRAGELTSPRLRTTLARSLRRIEREVQGGTLPGAVPLNARAIRAHRGLVRALQERLDDLGCPVSVRGMLLVDRLVTEPGSPLYSYAQDDLLAEAISEALAAIDLDPSNVAAAA